MSKRKTGKNYVADAVGVSEDRIGTLRLFVGMAAETVRAILVRIGEGVRRISKGETIVHEGTEAKWLVPVLSRCFQQMLNI